MSRTKIVVDLGRIDNDQLAPMRRQRGVDVWRAEAAEPVTMLDHDPVDRRIARGPGDDRDPAGEAVRPGRLHRCRGGASCCRP
jgi:hypothetical protein